MTQCDATADDSKENLRELREKAMEEYSKLGEEQQRLKRLDSLLEKSAAYVTFLSRKLESKREQLRTTDAQPAAKAEGKAKGRKRARVEPQPQPAADEPARQDQADQADQAGRQQPWTIDGVAVSPRQPRLVTGGVMREYQLEGMEWMASLYENGLNGILADEMGLGKTLQTIAFLSFLRERRVWGPFLVLCPLSTLSNWASEFFRFTPDTPVLAYHGTPDERLAQRKQHLSQRLGPDFPVVLTTYEIAMRDRQALQRLAWKFIIVDEGHRLKNMNCRLVRELKQYQSANRLLLTGTPLQNSLAELWSLLNFLLPDIFDDLDSFQAWFDLDDLATGSADRMVAPDTATRVVAKLHKILQPFLLRRLKSDVEAGLPPKREYLIACPMAPLQYEYYQAVRGPSLRAFIEDRVAGAGAAADDTLVPPSPSSTNGAGAPVEQRRRLCAGAYAEPGEDDPFDDGDTVGGGASASGGSPALQSSEPAAGDGDGDGSPLARLRAAVHVRQLNLQFRLMQQRKACQHPYMFDIPVEDPQDPESAYRLDEQLVRSSGKLLLLDRLLPALFAQGHRVLIFSQFSRMLDLLEFYAGLRDWAFCRIDGSVGQAERQQAIVRFNTHTEIPLFLLTTRSGGLGINLTSADTVVLFDSDWNPQQDLQAQDRVHRIGQQRPVLVYRLIIAGSCERAMLARANGKRKLEKLVIHEKHFKGLLPAAGKPPGAKDELSTSDIAQILMDDDAQVFEKDQQNLRDVLERLGPEDKVPDDAILTDEELRALTDRSPEAYAKSKLSDDEAARFEQLVETRDDQNDLLANMQ
ncbi:putative ATPase [Coemansia erecta]|uniref:ATPase n=1 Tax=Coemansia erecta TaxID=147472 RepID=A0A9W7XWI0_9FUNG|nr:putative ATPase [Coemansia erecta]